MLVSRVQQSDSVIHMHISFFFSKYLWILVVLRLWCFKWAFSSCGEWELLSSGARASHAVASLVAEHRLLCRLQQLQHVGSVVGAHGLSCYVAHEIFHNQRLSPCLLNLQANSLPLSHQDAPLFFFKFFSHLGCNRILSTVLCTLFSVLYSRSLLVIHLKYGSVYLPVPNSLTIPPHPSTVKGAFK